MLQQILNLSSMYKILISTVLGILAGYYSYTDNYLVKKVKYEEVKAEGEKIKQSIVDVNNFLAANPDVDEEIIKAEFTLKSLLLMLPYQKNVDNILSNLNFQSKDTGVNIVDFVPDPIETTRASSVTTVQNQSGTAPAAGTPGAPPNTPTPSTEEANKPNTVANSPNAAAATAQPGTPGSATPGAPDQANNVGKDPKKNQSFQEFKIRLTLEGTYPQIVSFLDRSMEMPRILSISHLQMSPINVDPTKIKDSPKLKVTTNINGYYQIGTGTDI